MSAWTACRALVSHSHADLVRDVAAPGLIEPARGLLCPQELLKLLAHLREAPGCAVQISDEAVSVGRVLQAALAAHRGVGDEPRAVIEQLARFGGQVRGV